MYKIIYNNQIIDVMDSNIRYVKYLPKTKKSIIVDKNQANGVVSSDGHEIYHIFNTKNTFPDERKTVKVVPIDEEEYLELTTQVKDNKKLEDRITELENLVKQLLEGK